MLYQASMQPLTIGDQTMKNRFVVPPLTRVRADGNHVPTDMMVKHYSDRAGFGLIIAEATMVQKGYTTFLREPGIFGPAQVAGWREVTNAVHAKGGLIYLQLFHSGRCTTEDNVAPPLQICSATRKGIQHQKVPALFTATRETKPFPASVHALTREEIAAHVELFATAAKNAIAAGFDGAQIHGANGYLIDQFTKDSSNDRTDEYGGSVANRCRFLFEVVDAVVAAIGKERTALRISPLNVYNEASDSDPEATTRYICEELNKRDIAFLDVLRRGSSAAGSRPERWARQHYKGVLFVGCGYTIREGQETLIGGGADAVCFGALSMANPDLVARVEHGAALNKSNPSLYYTGGAEGYNDYATLQENG